MISDSVFSGVGNNIQSQFHAHWHLKYVSVFSVYFLWYSIFADYFAFFFLFSFHFLMFLLILFKCSSVFVLFCCFFLIFFVQLASYSIVARLLSLVGICDRSILIGTRWCLRLCLFWLRLTIFVFTVVGNKKNFFVCFAPWKRVYQRARTVNNTQKVDVFKRKSVQYNDNNRYHTMRGNYIKNIVKTQAMNRQYSPVKYHYYSNLDGNFLMLWFKLFHTNMEKTKSVEIRKALWTNTLINFMRKIPFVSICWWNFLMEIRLIESENQRKSNEI